MKALYDVIHTKALSTWHSRITAENYDAFRQHWLDCARSFVAECNASGLKETAHAVERIIDLEEMRQSRNTWNAVSPGLKHDTLSDIRHS